MIRITMNIKHNSPFLQSISGDIIVEDIDFRSISTSSTPLFKCKFKHRPNASGYENPDGINKVVFDAVKSQMDTMIQSYVKGMLLSNQDYSWVEDSGNKPLEDWLKEKGEIYCDS